jgi:outer membrane receptor protein involved in Fe transport
MKKILIVLALVLGVQALMYAQETKQVADLTKEEIMALSYDDLLAMPFEDLLMLASKMGVSIDDLLKMKTSVASKTALTPRETPGIISIVTEEEIKALGARDLSDALALIPGINFTYDAQGMVGIQVRGNWGFEGKVLFIIDGMELNELQYNVFSVFNHIQADNIKRIEIIRGPGSAIYGGSAELGVVNILTKKGDDLKGLQVNGSGGLTTDALSKGTLNLALGDKRGDFQYSVSGGYSKSRMSDGKLIDSYGVFDMADTLIPMESSNVNLAMSYKGLSANFFYDYYRSDYGDYATSDAVYINKFQTLLGDISYDYAINSKFHVISKFSYKHSKPYYDDSYPFCISVDRYRPGLQAIYDLNEKINILAGADYSFDSYNMRNSDTISYFGNGKGNYSNNNLALYAQTLIKTNVANFTLGARYEKHSVFGSAIAPRFAITKAFERLHMKLLVSGAFRSPAIGNLTNTTTDSSYTEYNFARNNVKPEKTWVVEFEVGYKLNKNMFITANIFDITINNAIVWFENDYDWGYNNHSRTGTRGFELEYRAKYKKGFANLSYSYYTAKNKNKVDYYAVDGKEEYMLGSPQNKITLSGGYNILNNLTIGSSVIYRSKQYADFEGDMVKFDPTTTVNAFISYQSKYFDAGWGVNNIFNQDFYWIQPYKGSMMPFPVMSREFFIKLAFKLSREE